MISNYTDLLVAVSDWMHRSDLSGSAADFVRIGESGLNRKLRTVDMEDRHNGVMGTTDRLDSLPDGYLEMQSIYYTADNEEITFVEPSALIRLITSSGKPEHFTIKDGIEWSCVPDSAYAYEIHYFKSLDIEATNTNWLLTNHPDVYLYAAMASASLYINNDNRIAGIRALLNEAMDDLNTQDARKRGSQMVQMRTELYNSGYDIITG